ncbi:MAG: MoaD/ThiS family protein [Tepidisphaeraceae bacterium]
MVRVVLPQHLRTLAGVGHELALDVAPPVTIRAVLEAIERRHPMLQGAIRDHATLRRRPLVRFFACEEDLSHASVDSVLPDAVAKGDEPFFIVGAIAGG